MVFDLDPGEGADLRQCIQVAFEIKAVFEHLGLKLFPKVSGSKGLQLYVPLNRPTSYDNHTAVCPLDRSVDRKRAPEARGF